MTLLMLALNSSISSFRSFFFQIFKNFFHIIFQVCSKALFVTKSSLNKLVIEHNVDSRNGVFISTFISLFLGRIGTCQDYFSFLTSFILAINLIHDIVNNFDFVSVREELIIGEHINVNLHDWDDFLISKIKVTSFKGSGKP